jgi:hypothetical protein
MYVYYEYTPHIFPARTAIWGIVRADSWARRREKLLLRALVLFTAVLAMDSTVDPLTLRTALFSLTMLRPTPTLTPITIPIAHAHTHITQRASNSICNALAEAHPRHPPSTHVAGSPTVTAPVRVPRRRRRPRRTRAPSGLCTSPVPSHQMHCCFLPGSTRLQLSSTCTCG